MSQSIGLEQAVEKVFADEYWAPIIVTKTLPPPKTLGWGAKRWADSLCAQAATSIFLGDEQIAMPPGTNLGGEATKDITYPGAVYLVDLEMLLSSDEHFTEPDKNVPDWLSPYMRHPEDLDQPAAVVFRYNAEKARRDSRRNSLPFTTVYPYDKILNSSDKDQCYRRYVGLLMFANDSLDKRQGFFRREWDAYDLNQVQGKAPRGISRMLGYTALTIGETYFGESYDHRIRLRSASKCPVEYDMPGQPQTPKSQRF